MIDFYFDKVRWLSIALGVHPFSWGFQIDRDARDKSVSVTVGPVTVGVNW